MKTVFKYLVILGIFLGGLVVLADQHGLGKDAPHIQSSSCCASISADTD
jgi:hypothetical protein